MVEAYYCVCMETAQVEPAVDEARLAEIRGLARCFADQVRQHFGDRLCDIVLFGSAARTDWTEDSDIDILVLLDEAGIPDKRWIVETATDLGVLGEGPVISPITLPQSEFLRLRQRERLFAQEVDEQGITL